MTTTPDSPQPSHPTAPTPPAAPTAPAAPAGRTAEDARALLARLTAEDAPPFALLHRRNPELPPGAADRVEVLIGELTEVDSLAGIPLPAAGEAPGTGGAVPDVLALVPFRQIRERGFEVREDGTPLYVLRVREHLALPLAEAVAALPVEPVELADGAFDIPDDTYAATVRRVLEEEIAQGEGANFVVRRDFTGTLRGYSPAVALTLFRRLLLQERGAYWTHLVHTGRAGGGRVLVGASPEVHVRMTAGAVTMNPISGTYRYPAGGPTVEHLLEFLHDPKEIDELSMVVDEELKMMCTVGDLGGRVVGPRLREMSRLAHTEYELVGRTTLDAREVLRETMFAATVTGSPVENACRVIARHEPTGRGYYAGALALIGRDEHGRQTVDSPILIRTADIDASGRLTVKVGATLVRHSTPEGEVAETWAKASGVLRALGVPVPTEAVAGRPAAQPRVPAARAAGSVPGAPGATGPGATGPGAALAADPRVAAALAARREVLAPFWLRDDATVRPAAVGQPALVVDCADTFTAMLAHLLRSLGLRTRVLRFDDRRLPGALAEHDGLVVLGPGPGDPEDADDPRMARMRRLTRHLLAGGLPAGGFTAAESRARRRPLLGVCLGHEMLAAELGLPLRRRRTPHQGAQLPVEVFGERQLVGFYNSFTAVCDEERAQRLALRGIEVSRDAATGEVHALRGPGLVGLQFHPESVLTVHGVDIVSRAVRELCEPAATGAPARR
ncbi:anthranilate synthase family protein [Allostreptomyces psammosilenae]|uniref:anthranilate synthase n=1 Tax=Allostreptomyces psammosilenae TaxID=1892865 RepID=A0A853A9G5_9ACTN|nr:anthranilate synthase family protein [Allostreptomyces psammosilenae]NYI07052.1 phenazine biosynthesis protein phzE [Allostreptomyces psammosilenae]